MAGGAAMKKAICVALVSVLVVAWVADGAITCGQVIGSLGSCVPYATNRGPLGRCCGGVKRLYGAVRTTPDRRTVCYCLKSLAGSVRGINFGKVAGLPRTCGVSIPYSISPRTDCSRVR